MGWLSDAVGIVTNLVGGNKKAKAEQAEKDRMYNLEKERLELQKMQVVNSGQKESSKIEQYLPLGLGILSLLGVGVIAFKK